MLWIDSDAFATRIWDKDPVDYFLRNDGAIMFEHFPQGNSNFRMQTKIFRGFNRTICGLKLSKETGNLVSTLGAEQQCRKTGIPNIHGFFHLTDLDLYRSPAATRGLAGVFAGCFLDRTPDDQLAVTAVAAILAPARAWEMHAKGFRLGLFHNFRLDEVKTEKLPGFKRYWRAVARHTLPTADGVCKIRKGS